MENSLERYQQKYLSSFVGAILAGAELCPPQVSLFFAILQGLFFWF